MKIGLNPIVKKDIRVNSRSFRLSLGLFIYELILMFTLFIIMSIIQATSRSYYSPDNIYSGMVYIFPVLAIMQAGIVALITPILTASSISGERERQTFDIMLTTCMSPISIIIGKVTTSVIRVMLYVVASIPIMSLSFVIGGTSWSTLFGYLVCMIILAILAGSIGIFCSSLSNKSITAVILSFVFYFIIMAVTFLPMIIELLTRKGNIYDSLLFMLVNPICFFEEFFMLSITQNSLFGGLGGKTAVLEHEVNGLVTQALMHGPLWLILSGICLLLLSFLFILAAAKTINPLYAKTKKKRKNKKNKDND